jgi:predicted nucleotidyltransferase
MPYGLTESTLSAIRGVLLGHHEVKRALLYGSRAKGTQKKGSDIDVALDGPAVSFRDLLQIETQLDALDLPYHFDVSVLQRLTNPELLDHIQRVGCDLKNPETSNVQR